MFEVIALVKTERGIMRNECKNGIECSETFKSFLYFPFFPLHSGRIFLRGSDKSLLVYMYISCCKIIFKVFSLMPIVKKVLNIVNTA